jgi:hypothetical protein
MLVAHERTAEGVPDRVDAEEVVELALKSAGGKRECGEGRNGGVVGVDTDMQLDATIGGPGAKDINDAQDFAVVMSGDQGEAKPRFEQCRSSGRKLVRRDELLAERRWVTVGP